MSQLEKYKKYKNAYINLKFGGNLQILSLLNKYKTNLQSGNMGMLRGIIQQLNTNNACDVIAGNYETYRSIIEEIKNMSDKYNNNPTFVENISSMKALDCYRELFNINNISVVKYILKDCTIEELMTLNRKQYDLCSNASKLNVVGSCGDNPSFEGQIGVDIKHKNMMSFINLFDNVMLKLENTEHKNIVIMLGAVTNFQYYDNGAIILCITPSNIHRKLSKISFGDIEINKQIFINAFFPLDHTTPNSKIIYEKLCQMMDMGIKIKIINKMCGSCFRFLYALVQYGAEYSVNPEQGTKQADTPAILSCFKN